MEIWHENGFPPSEMNAITKPYPEVDFRLYSVILKNRYDVITPPPIVQLLRHI